MDYGRGRACRLVATATFVAMAAVPVRAADRQDYHLPPQSLASSLRAVGIASGHSVAAPASLVEGRIAPSVDGRYRVNEVIELLLARSGLRVKAVAGGFVIERDEGGRGANTLVDRNDIVVTGSRIRGAPIASPVLTLTREDIRNAGQSTVADAVRTIPQNFNGGQNPGVGFNVPATSGVNVGSATSINLRGIGSDATLTLVNGHRLSYSASRQAIDVSTIPLGAVERIEVVPDGASALYGSDAVAGVANLVLRSRFDGLEPSVTLGRSLDGGNFEQRYGLVGGTDWTSGGVVAALEYGRTTAIEGRDRSYTAARQPSLTLFPGMRNRSGTISANQTVLPGLRLELDALYNDRTSRTAYSLSPTGDITASGARLAYESESFVLAPTLRFGLGSSWRTFLTGSYGQDHTRYDVTSYSAGRATNTPNNCYCNNAKAVELGGDGTLLRLPGGAVKLALGAGYRANDFVRYNGVGATTNVSRKQDSYFGYGELSVPLVAPAQQLRFVDRLSLSGALRYEDYHGVGDVATPKLGLIYAPTPDLDVKGSWGRSFRAPTLYQQYQARNVVVAAPSIFGGSGYPAGTTALFVQGGNPDLKPERARTWTATLDLHPRALAGAKLELSYFSIDYRDRIVTPIAFLGQSLSNPLYADRVTANPDQAFLAAVVASAISFGNATGRPYDPTSVRVFIDGSNVNAGRQSIRGADALFTYRIPLGPVERTLGLMLDATYLASDQQLGPGKPVVDLAGIIFNPPHVRARGGIDAEGGGVHLGAIVSYIGGVDDTRTSRTIPVKSMTTLDLSARARLPAGNGLLSGLDLVVALDNVFDARPAAIATTLLYDAPYDSTNQSPVGRFLSVSVAKKW